MKQPVYETSVRLPPLQSAPMLEKFTPVDRISELVEWMVAEQDSARPVADLLLQTKDIGRALYTLVVGLDGVLNDFETFVYRDVSDYSVMHVDVLDRVVISFLSDKTTPYFYQIVKSQYTIVDTGKSNPSIVVQKYLRWLSDDGLHNPRSRFMLKLTARTSGRNEEAYALGRALLQQNPTDYIKE